MSDISAADDVKTGAERAAKTSVKPAISLTEPDWSREKPRQFWDPSRKLLKSIRDYQQANGSHAGLKRKFAVLRHRFWSIVCGCDIPITCNIGGGLLMPHTVGIVISPLAKIGMNCLIMQNTTLGVAGTRPGAPVLGNGCDISVGACVLGPVMIGDRALVAANAVVTKDVPPRQVVAGVPAQPIGDR